MDTEGDPLGAGPGYGHFPMERTEEYFRQLTVERQVTKYNKGHAVRVWMKPDGAQGEALDCRVYATAALAILNPDLAGSAASLAEARPPEPKPKKRKLRIRGRLGGALTWKTNCSWEGRKSAPPCAAAATASRTSGGTCRCTTRGDTRGNATGAHRSTHGRPTKAKTPARITCRGCDEVTTLKASRSGGGKAVAEPDIPG